MCEFGFIIPSYINSQNLYKNLLNCIDNIRSHHQECIVIILDTPEYIDILRKDLTKYKDILITENEYKTGEMNPYYFYYKNPLFKKAIIIHDSMHLLNKIENIDKIDDISFIWHFTHHRVHWHIINEPITEYNQIHNIITHDDKMKNFIQIADLKPEFKTWCLKKYDNKTEWCGCFGIMSIITYEFLTKLHDVTNILECLKIMKDRRDRVVMESLFALACHYVLPKNYELSYDGLYYDGKYHNGFKTSVFYKISYGR